MGRRGGDAWFRCFLALEGHPLRPDARIQHFPARVQGAPGGSLGGSSGGVVLGIWAGFRVFLSDGASEYTCGWVAPRELAMGEALHLEAQPSPRGCIRPVSNGTTHCPSSKSVSRCRV